MPNANKLFFLLKHNQSITPLSLGRSYRFKSTSDVKTIIQVNPSKSKKAKIMKHLHSQNKKIYGELLETQYVKLKKKKYSNDQVLSRHTHEKINISHKNLGPGLLKQRLDPDVKTNASISVEIEDPTDHLVLSKVDQKEKKYVNEIESEWTLNQFPQRAKILKRSLPEKPIYCFKEESNLISSSIPQEHYNTRSKNQYIKKVQENPIELQETRTDPLPSVNQLIHSVKASPDILNYSRELKFVNQEKLSSDNETCDEGIENAKNSELEKLNTKEVDSTLQNLECSFDDLQIKQPVNSPASTGIGRGVSSALLFPFDNPLRSETTVESLIESHKIISLPFNSASVQEKSTEENEDLTTTVTNQQQKLNFKARIPSVTKILNETMPPEQVEILKKWEQKMIAKLGEEGFKKYKADLFANGKELHENIRSCLSGVPTEELKISDGISGHWESVKDLLPQLQPVIALESFVRHPKLEYCGIVDCVATYEKDKIVVIDWKTSEKPKPFISNTYDTPLQIAAYIGAINYDRNYSVKVTKGLIVVVYQDGTKYQKFYLGEKEIEHYWKTWVKRLKQYEIKEKS